MESDRFSFGEVANTEYASFEQPDNQPSLPYNPFAFDLTLTLKKSKSNYEEPGLRIPLPKDGLLLLARKKKSSKPPPTDSQVYFLLAETISEHHLSIDPHYQLHDLNSKKGTFLWTDRAHPRKLELHDLYLLAKEPLLITQLTKLPSSSLSFSFRGDSYRPSVHQRLFLIGSDKRCDIVVGGLQQFQVSINLNQLTIFTHREPEEAAIDTGLWYQLKPSQTAQLTHGSIIMVEPYVFELTS